MHQTLYRKYRPINFNDVYGQKVIVKILENQIKNDSLSHAYLFAGPRGTGKTSIAKILAKAVNCVNEEVQPCNQCVNCTQISKNDSLDIVEIDAASNNGIDEIRELKSKVGLVPTNGKYKVYIIDEVHMLTTAAFNALLKTLEEPPSHIIFILATTEQHKIPETILSRCQKFEFKRISDSELINRLKEIAKNENIDITEEALKEIARLSDGGMRDSIGNLELVAVYQTDKIEVSDVHEITGIISNKEIAYLLKNLLDSDIKAILGLIDEYYSNGKNLIRILEETLIFLKNCLVVKNIPNYFEDALDFESINRLAEYSLILEIINEISKSLHEIKKYSNAKLMIEIMFINLISSKIQPNQEFPKPTEKPIQIKQEFENLKEPEVELLKELKTEEPKKINIIQINDEFEELKNIRVDNTLSNVSKTKLLELKEKISKVDLSDLDQESKKYFHYILDGEIKAASENNYIIVFETQTLKDYYNKAIKKIEKVLKEVVNIDYRTIAIDSQEWEKYRMEFKNKIKKYEYQDDKIALEKFLSTITKEKNTIESKFSDLIKVK